MESSHSRDSRHFLVCPLEWGLGHAARCIPVIRFLLNRGHKVTIAADGRPFELLRGEFPGLDMVRLPGYGISYPTSGGMALKMLLQTPGMVRGMAREQGALRRLEGGRRIDAVISDSRFGLYSDRIPCVYITHQLFVRCPPRLRLLEPLLGRLHRSVIGRYRECWIPDYAGKPNLSGELSHRGEPPPNARFIGPLSRFQGVESASKGWDLLVILSGPEPQRTIFERLVITQAAGLPLKTLVVQGRAEVTEKVDIADNLTLVSHLGTRELGEALCGADVVLARPGYSTIMDLAASGRRAVLVPTPGQTEQEYLARKFMEEGAFYSELQRGFDLRRALERVRGYGGRRLKWDGERALEERVGGLFET